MTILAVLLAGLMALILVLSSVRVVPEQDRLAVLRLGRFTGIRGPGVVLVVPFVDKAVRINLDREVPNWRSRSSRQLAEEIERWVKKSGLEA